MFNNKMFLQNLCKKFTRTYDADIVAKNTDTKTQKQIRDVCIALHPYTAQLQNIPTFNYTLFLLLYNRFVKDKDESFDYIVGPCSIHKFYSKKYQKTVYLIGEVHGIKEFGDRKDAIGEKLKTLVNKYAFAYDGGTKQQWSEYLKGQ